MSSASSRRLFLKASATAVLAAGCNNGKRNGGPTTVPAAAVGGGKEIPPSDRLTVGFIGIGNMGTNHLTNFFLNAKEVQLVAMCDVREEVRNRACQKVEERYAERFEQGSYNACQPYLDYKEMLARPDLDAVLIAAPEHWHGLLVFEACRAGKDIYCEKPLSHTIREAREMVNHVRRYNRILQTGSQQRSSDNFRFACELVRNQRIGRLKTVYVNVGGTSSHVVLPEEPIPKGLDWERWLGPAPWTPYNAERASGSYTGGWRMIRDYSGGMMTDWGAHHFDIAQWALGMDESGPVGVNPPDKDHPVLTYTYPNGVRMLHMNGPGADKTKTPHGRKVNGVLFEGERGWVEVNRGYLRTHPETVMRESTLPSEVRLYRSRQHQVDWINAIKTRRPPICDVEVGARSITVCHLGNIAYWLNRPIKWDPAKEQIVGDEAASRLLDIPRRSPWVV
jgi:predicted dehydrogenase